MSELRQGRGGDRTNPPRITWIRAGDRYPELADELDHFLPFGTNLVWRAPSAAFSVRRAA